MTTTITKTFSGQWIEFEVERTSEGVRIVKETLLGKRETETALQPGPEGFVLGTAAKWVGVAHWEIEWRQAWIRETDTGADVIWIDHRGDYSGLFERVPADHVKLAA